MTLKQSMLAKHPKIQKRSQKISLLKVSGYTAVFLVIVGVIAAGYQAPTSSQQLNQVGAANLVVTDNQVDEKPSVDQIVATDVAASLTERTNLPIASSVANTSISLATKNELAQTDDATISKPQILQPTSVSRDMRYYSTVRGESVEDVAKRFNLSANTIRWANNLSSDALRPNQKLTILPTDGVVHTLARGESVESLADKYKTSVARIVAFNDLELSKPKAGQKLIIPSGVLPVSERPGYEAPSQNMYGGSSYGGSSSSTILDNSLLKASAGNRYAPGNCTWYAYERRQELGMPVGSFWGNANTWAANATAAGYLVDHTPKPGAVFQTAGGGGGYGHVAIVEQVKPNGDVVLSEMNYAGFNVVSSRTISAGQAASYNYIH